MAPYKKAKPFTESDLDDPESFTNKTSHHKLVKYRHEGKARKGEDFNPSQDPFDTELVMTSGGGRSHGSQAIGDGLIRCPKTLPQIKKRLSSSDPEITPRARPRRSPWRLVIQTLSPFLHYIVCASVDDYNANEEWCVAGIG